MVWMALWLDEHQLEIHGFLIMLNIISKTAEHLPYPMINERIDMARRHLEMSIKWKGEKLGVLETRRHYSNYFKGIP